MSIFNRRLNICRSLLAKHNSADIMFAIFKESFFHKTNLTSCPVLATVYQFKKFSIDSDKIPLSYTFTDRNYTFTGRWFTTSKRYSKNTEETLLHLKMKFKLVDT